MFLRENMCSTTDTNKQTKKNKKRREKFAVQEGSCGEKIGIFLVKLLSMGSGRLRLLKIWLSSIASKKINCP